MIINFKIFEEQEVDNRILIIKKGHTLFHSSVEKFSLPLRVSAYDKILWTAEDSGISQTYIPVSSTMHTSTNFLKKPRFNDNERLIQKQLGIIYDYDRVEWDSYRAKSYISPDIFREIRDEYFNLRDIFNKKEKEYKILYDKVYKEKMPLDERKIKIRELSKLKEELDGMENEVYGSGSDKKENKLINDILINKFGYKPIGEDNYNYNHSWKLKVEYDKLLPADYRSKGRLFILKPKRDLKIYDYSKNREGDLTDLDYHKVDLFRKCEDSGYDGIKINDFAQVESEGNFGHKSIGLFKNTIKYLSIEILDDVTHPNGDDIEKMYRSGDWMSKEYKKYIGKE